MWSVVASSSMTAISPGSVTSHSNTISTVKCYFNNPLHPVLYRHIKYPSNSTLMTTFSRRNSAANSMGRKNSFPAAKEPVTKYGTSNEETPISLAMFHFLNAKVNAAATLLPFSYTRFFNFWKKCF